MPHRIKVDDGRLLLTRLAPGEMESLSYTVTFLMRGYYQLGPLLLETGDVFGLHRRFRVTGEPHFALVLPKVLPLEGYNLASRRPLGEIRVVHRLFEDPTRLAGVRRFQQGDPLNRIHWRATARTGEIHSRLYENSRVAGATFLLDFHTQSFQGAGGANSAELAIVTVASLANAVFLMGQQIGLVSNGRDAADRIREEGWRAEFITRADAQQRARPIRCRMTGCARCGSRRAKAVKSWGKFLKRSRGWNTRTDWNFPRCSRRQFPRFRAMPPSCRCCGTSRPRSPLRSAGWCAVDFS